MAGAERFDVVFIGAGPGGYIGALRAAQNGLKTAVVDRETRPGGTCLLRGCIPTKALLEAASLYERLGQAKEFGLKAEGVGFEWSGVNARKEKVVEKNAKGVGFLFRKHGVEHLVGVASLSAPGEVSVALPSGERRVISAKHVVLATGSGTRHLPDLAPVDGRRVFTSDELLQIDRVPASMIVVGAGAVGVEFASVFHRFGCKVSLVEQAPRLLPIEDEEISAEYERILRRQGIASLTSAEVKAVEVSKSGVKVGLSAQGKEQTLEAETLLWAVGRRPVTEGLGLERFPEVKLDRGFVVTDSLLRTPAPWLSAIGDVVSIEGGPHPQLAHVASAEAVLVADRLAGKEVRALDYERGIIGATYSDPQVASVGLSEAKARARHGAIRVGKFPFAAVGKAAVIGETAGFIKWVAAEKHDELLGLHIIGPKATELIHEGLIALKLEATGEEIAQAVHAHPTLSEGLMEAAHALLGKAIGA